MSIEDRKEREKEERRRLILRAALEVYNHDGYHGTTMEKIAEKAELSRATLYLYFKTKDEIFVHSIAQFLSYFRELLDELYKRAKRESLELLPALWNIFIEFYRKDPVAFNASLYFHQSEMLRNLPKQLRLILDEAGSKNYRALCKIVEFGIETSYFIKANPKTLAEVIWSTFLGIIHLENSKRAMGRKTHLETTCKLAFNVFEQGILAGGQA